MAPRALRNLFRFSLGNIRRGALRSALTLIGVALGTSLFVAVSSINDGVSESLDRDVRSLSLNSQLIVTSRSGFLFESILRRLESFSGVRRAVGTLENKVQVVGTDGGAEAVTVVGLDLLQGSALPGFQVSKSSKFDVLAFLNQPDSIIVSQELARSRGWSVGSRISLRTAAGTRALTVRGLLEPVGLAKAYAGNLAVMDIDGARLIFDERDRLNRVNLFLKPGELDEPRIEAVKTRLQAELGPGYLVESPEDQNKQLGQLIRGIQALQALISAMGLLVAGVNVFITMRISVLEQRRSIALLRCVGAERRQVITLILIEAFVMGALGAIIGVCLGPYLAGLFQAPMLGVLESSTGVRPEGLSTAFPWRCALQGVGAGILVSLVAAYWPARKAVELEVLEGLSEEARPRSPRAATRGDRIYLAIGLAWILFSWLSCRYGWILLNMPLNVLTRAGLIVGPALFCVFVVFACVGLIERVLGDAISLPLRLGSRNILTTHAKLGSTILLLAIGIGFVVLSECIAGSFEWSARSWARQRYQADFIVVSTLKSLSGIKNPFSEALGKEILGIEGIRKPGEGEGVFSRSVPYLHQGDKVRLVAIDKPPPFARAQYAAGIERLFEGDFILLSEGFLSRYPGLKVGDGFALSPPGGTRSFVIAGTFRDYSSRFGSIMISRKAYSDLWKDSSIDEIQLFSENPAKLAELKARLQSQLGARESSLTFWPNELILKETEAVLNRNFKFSRGIEKLTLLIILFGLMNTFLANAISRSREIGLLRAVGATRAQVSRMILGEAVLLSSITGVVAATLVASGSAFFVTHAFGPLFGWIVDYVVDPMTMAGIILTAIGVSLVSCVYPLYRTLAKPIVRSLSS